MANDGINVPGEGEGNSLSPQLHREAVEAKARDKGWKPLEEYKGEAADWVDAPEFVGRQGLYDTIHNLKRQLNRQQSRFDKDMQVISKHLAEVKDTAYKQAMADLEQRHVQAIREDDAVEAAKVAREMADKAAQHEQAKVQAQQAQQPAAQVTEEFLEWKSQNKWFEENAEMQQDAVAYGVGYAAANPNKDQAAVLAYVTTKIKQMYPEKFQTTQRKAPVNQVEGGSNGSGKPTPGGKKKLSVNDLTQDEQQIMKTLIRRGALDHAAKKNNRSPQEEYLAQIADAK